MLFLRTIVRNPGFVLTAVASLAFGLGANTTIFSVVNAFLLRPLPIEAPEEMVEIYTSNREGNPYAPSSYPDFLEIREETELFEGVTAYMIALAQMTTNDARTEVILGELVTGNYFSVLGVDLEKGRAFLPEEDATPMSHPVTVISHDLWQRRFAGDPAILNRVLVLNGLPFTIIGVGAESYKGVIPGLSSDFWVPTMMLPHLRPEQPDDLELRGSRGMFIKARRQAGVSTSQVNARLEVLSQQLLQAYPQTNEGHEISALSSTEVQIHPRADRALVPASILLMVVVGLVLVIACTNVAGLQVARAARRSKEIAIRLALGADRREIIRLVLFESVLLSFLGGLVGLLLSGGLLHLLMRFKSPLPIPIALDLGIDFRVFFFAAILSLLSGILFGLLPALQASRPSLVDELKDHHHSPGRSRSRAALVVVQVAVSLVLLVGAGLFLRSLQKAQATQVGFDTERSAVAWLNLGVQGYGETEGRAFFEQLLERTAGLGQVRSAALTDRLPLDLNTQTLPLLPDDRTLGDDEEPLALDFARITGDYFDVLGIGLNAGRTFQRGDTPTSTPVIILSRYAAERLWPGESALGKYVRQGDRNGPLMEVVGLVENTKVRSLGELPRGMVYRPWSQTYESSMQMIASTEGDPRNLLPPLRDQIASLDSDLSLFALKTLEQHLASSLLPLRVAAVLFGAFGLVALLLACMGIYGVMSFFVTQRIHEIGVRMALGADARDVLRLVILRGMRLVAFGLLVGFVLAAVVAPGLQNFLVGIGGFDPVTFFGVSFLLAAVAFLTILVPARRATRVSPMETLARRF